jgi:hypothetical protein
MVCFGVIKVQRDLVNAPTFYGKTAPILGNKFIPEALAVSGISRDEHMKFPQDHITMAEFEKWLKENNEGKATFVSDNPAFDYQWINYYFVRAGFENPFGHSARRIGDFYAGLMKDYGSASKWKSLRKTKHTHHPVDDARGNAEALITMCDAFGVRLPGVTRLPNPQISNTVN